MIELVIYPCGETLRKGFYLVENTHLPFTRCCEQIFDRNFYTKKGSENPISAANRYLGLSFAETVKKLGIKHSSRLMMGPFTYDINFLQVFFHILLESIGNLVFQ